MSLTVADAVNQNEWHLPTYDPRNENKYHYKLHSLDIYFWTQQDALQFVSGVRRVLPPAQVEVLDEPASATQQPAHMSDVVRKLETAAISDPQYNGGLPPPPPPPAGAPAASAPAQQPASFVPMAYNPAAPAAPEAIKPREKTPPPDEDPLNPLAVAVAYDYQKQPFTPGFPHQPAQVPPGLLSPGLMSPGMPPAGLASPGLPPGQPGLQRSATMPATAMGGLASPGLTSPYGAGFAPPPPPPPQSQPVPVHVAQPQQQPTPPVTSPGLPPPPPTGFSNFSYAQQSQAPAAQTVASPNYGVHQQFYQPTEEEAAAAGAPVDYQQKPEARGKLEENAGRLERGVSGMLKKFEKKFG